nr:putative reverse transcriptase domain-containing protein [Tanacetum cinerariifolium]
DDSFSIDDIDYVEASPPDHELVSSEVMEIVIPLKKDQEMDKIGSKPDKNEKRLKNRQSKPYLDKFVIVFIDDILIYSKTKEDHDEQAFQTLKDNLCDAPILSLLDGIEDFVVYCDASNQGLGCVLMKRGKVITYASRQLKIHEKNYTTRDELRAAVFTLKTWRHYLYRTKSVIYMDHKSLQHIFDQKELNMCQRRWNELFNNYECEIHYHRGKANVVADALSRKEQSEGFKEENVPAERLHGLDQRIERKEYESLYFIDHVWVPLVGGVRTIIMDEDDMTSARVNYFGSRWTVYITFLANITKFFSDAIGYEYGLSSSDGWIRSPILWAKIKESRLIAPKLVQKMTDKVVLIKKKLKAARDRQKSYADNRRPYEILERIRPVAYRLRLPEELSSMHDTFHVSNLKKCLADANLHVPLDEIKIDKTLRFVEEPVEIMDCEVKSLKHSKILNVKVRWYLKHGPKFT